MLRQSAVAALSTTVILGGSRNIAEHRPTFLGAIRTMGLQATSGCGVTASLFVTITCDPTCAGVPLQACDVNFRRAFLPLLGCWVVAMALFTLVEPVLLVLGLGVLLFITGLATGWGLRRRAVAGRELAGVQDRKSTRLNSS